MDLKARTCTLIILGLIPSLVACTPEKWARELELKLKCDMTVKEAQALTSYKIVEHEVPIFWETHDVSTSDTSVRLGFQKGRLKFVQLSWIEQMTRIAFFQRVDLCGTAAPSSDLVHRLPPKR